MFNKKKFFIEIKKKLHNKEIPRIDLHNHTNWTDGTHSVKEMYNESLKKKITHFLFSEHSRKTSGKWFNLFADQIKKLPSDKCIPLIGTEVKIEDFKGNLDISQNIKKKCDLIMASVHRFPGEVGNIKKKKLDLQNKEIVAIEYELSKSAIKNSNFDIMGHPFGMSLKRFKIDPPFKFFIDLIKICKKNDKAFEINFNYHKNPKKLLSACIDYDCFISLGSNSHKKSEVGKILNEKNWK